MNWFERIEQKGPLIVGGIIVICLAMIFVTVRLNNISFDSFWHLKSGLDWINNGLSLWTDHYSFTFDGESISGPPFIFQVVLGWLVMQFGLDSGFELYKLFSFILAFGLMLFFLRKLKSTVIVYCLVLPVLIVLFQMRALVRPELISYSFSILAMILYYRAQNKITFAKLMPIALLMLVWSNYHSSIFGYVIFFGFFIDAGLFQFKNRENLDSSIWGKWLFWGLVVLAVGFMNTGFNHSIIAAITFPEEWKTFILEYRSPVTYRQVWAMYSLIIFAIVSVVLLARSRQFGLLIVCAVLGYAAMSTSRLVTPAGIVFLCVFAWTVSDLNLRGVVQNMSNAPRRILGVLIAIVFTASLISSVHIARSFMKDNRAPTPFPVDVVDYMVAHDIKGRMFNSYGIGGYLIYRLAPDSKVYIDGRTEILYPVDHFIQFINSSKSPAELRSEIDRYGINLAVISNAPFNFMLAHNTGVLSLDYVGSKYSLFKEGDSNFPLLGSILASPACILGVDSSELELEKQRAEQLLPANSALSGSLIDYMVDYSKAGDKLAFVSSQKVDETWSIVKLRLTAYWATEAGMGSLANELFSSLNEKLFVDYLALSLAQIQMGNWDLAEQTLDHATRASASYNPDTIALLHGLLVHVSKNSTLGLFDDKYINGLAANSEPLELESENSLPAIKDFCF